MEEQQTKPEGEVKPEKTSFWKTFPGILTGIAALVTAVATLLAAADKVGLFAETNVVADPPKQQDVGGGGVTTSGDDSPIIQDVGGDVTIGGNQ